MNTSSRSTFSKKQTSSAGRYAATSLSLDDQKVLGRALQRRTAALPKDAFTTKKYKTHHSAWTPVVNKASNQQIFEERSDLISHWFDLWTSRQRKTFLATILGKCERSQLLFTHQWFQEQAVIRHLDFTTVLPRFLCLYILSFLDPRTLSRASQVSWNWKGLAEQDSVWMPKCLKLGWYLPYMPSDLETGGWKRHYILCTTNLDIVPVNDEFYSSMVEMRQTKAAAGSKKNLKRGDKLSLSASKVMFDNRPSWVVCGNVKDIDKESRAFLAGFNPNTPKAHPTETMFHNKWGQVRKEALANTSSLLTGHGLGSRQRKVTHRLNQKSAVAMSLDSGLAATRSRGTAGDLLSNSLAVGGGGGGSSSGLLKGSESTDIAYPPPHYQHAGEARMKELVQTKWKSPYTSSPELPTRANIGSSLLYPSSTRGGGDRRLSAYTEPHSHPRVVFISSRVPGAELLLDAVIFGVIPIVYEFEGSTVPSLLRKLDQALNGRTAECIGLVTDQLEPGEVRLTQGACYKREDLRISSCKQFFKTLANSVLPAEEGGHIDLFSPLASSEDGADMLTELKYMTEMEFTSPASLVSGYDYLLSEWYGFSADPLLSAPYLYFCEPKLNIWIPLANHVADVTATVTKETGPILCKKSHSLLANISGEILYDVLGKLDITSLKCLWPVLVQGIVSLKWNKKSDPLHTLAQFLMAQSDGQKEKGQNGYAGSQNETGRNDLIDENTKDSHQEKQADSAEEIESDIESETTSAANERPRKEVSANVGHQMSPVWNAVPGPQMSHLSPTQSSSSLSLRISTHKWRVRVTAEEYKDFPDKRTMIARELVATEIRYLQCLAVISDFYVVPLRKAVSSHRAILSSNSIHTVFADVIIILDIGRALLKELKSRLRDWSTHQCLGDVFVKFVPKLKAYMSFLKNYVMMLDTLDKCIELQPPFRAFLKSVEYTPQSMMMSLHELLLLPSERIEAYVCLLSWFKQHTPLDHPDREDLTRSLSVLYDLQKVIKETKVRVHRDKKLIMIQELIRGCPILLESNRYFLTQADVSVLKPTKETAPHEKRLYVHTESYGLFLFNDALVITRLLEAHYPFQKATDRSYHFIRSIALTHLKVWELPDTRYAQNMLMVEGGGVSWYVTLSSYDEKFEFVTSLLSAIDTAIMDSVNI